MFRSTDSDGELTGWQLPTNNGPIMGIPNSQRTRPKPGRRPKLSQAERAALRVDRAAGMSWAQLAETWGIALSTAQRIVQESGEAGPYELRPEPPRPEPGAEPEPGTHMGRGYYWPWEDWHWLMSRTLHDLGLCLDCGRMLRPVCGHCHSPPA